MFRRYILFFVLLISVIVSGYSFRDLDWLKHESEHFVYIYHNEVAGSVSQIEEIAENTFLGLSELFGNPFRDKISILIGGYEDRSNGLANPVMESIYIMTIGLDYPYRNDGFWLEEVITHELSHLFQITATTQVGNFLRNYFSRLYLPNALQPMWFTEGFAQLGSELIGDLYEYDYRRLPFLWDQLDREDPFLEETVVSGHSGIGGEAYYNYGYAFLTFLNETYGFESIQELVRIKSGILGFAGIDFSFERVYGKSYQELKAEFIDFESEKWKGVETPSIHRLSSDIGEFVSHYRSKTYANRLYYIGFDREQRYYTLYREDTEILRTSMEIIDFAVFENEIALLLFEKEVSETRLYFFREGRLERTKYSHLVGIDFAGKDRLAILRNSLGTMSVEILSLRNERVTTIFAAIDPEMQITSVRASQDGALVAFRVNMRGNKYIAFYSSGFDAPLMYKIDKDFSLGSWTSGGFLISVENGFGSSVYLVTSEGEMTSLATFPRYVRDPARTREGIVAVGQVKGNKLLYSVESKTTEFKLKETTVEMRVPEPLEGEKYEGFTSWRFVSPIPYKGLSLLFSDLTFHNHLIAGGSFDFGTMLPSLHLELCSIDYTPVDFTLSFEFSDLNVEASLEAYRQYVINPKLAFGWKAELNYPLQVSGSINVVLQDSSVLYGGQASLKTNIAVRDTQTATSNLVDVGIRVDFDWKKNGFALDSAIFSRVTFGEDPSLVPVELWDFRDDSNIVVGLSISSDYTISRRGFNLINLVHLSEEGIGAKIDTLIGRSFSWRLAIYKFETVYLYAAYPMKIKAGIMLESMRLLPYIDFALLY